MSSVDISPPLSEHLKYPMLKREGPGIRMVLVELGIVGGILGLIILIIAILILVFIIGTLIAFLPATLAGIIVWLLTGDFTLGAIAFLVIALIMVLARW
jgi:hypothetical protein